MDATAIIPIKGLSTAKERLASGFEPLDRALIATATAGHVIRACVDARCPTIVVTDDDAVARLAGDLGATTLPDPGEGLDAAVAAGIESADEAWLVIHADLPLLDAAAVSRACRALEPSTYLIAAARDGGTNLLGGVGPFRPAYGPGSFHRHLGRIGRTGSPIRILIDETLAIEIDTPHDLAVAAGRPGGQWLRSFLS
jgi:2-phospho-L-lactate guanylyltransferase